jgi:hypothetical protein
LECDEGGLALPHYSTTWLRTRYTSAGRGTCSPSGAGGGRALCDPRRSGPGRGAGRGFRAGRRRPRRGRVRRLRLGVRSWLRRSGSYHLGYRESRKSKAPGHRVRRKGSGCPRRQDLRRRTSGPRTPLAANSPIEICFSRPRAFARPLTCIFAFGWVTAVGVFSEPFWDPLNFEYARPMRAGRYVRPVRCIRLSCGVQRTPRTPPGIVE